MEHVAKKKLNQRRWPNFRAEYRWEIVNRVSKTCVFEQGLHIPILSCSNFHIVCANDLVPFSINKHGHTRWPSNLKTVCDSYVEF